MKNVIRSVSGLAAFAVGVLLSTNAIAGFQLSLGNFQRTGASTFEIDVLVVSTSVPSQQTIQFLTYNLEISPADGYSLSAIAGAQFDGTRNPSSNALFSNPFIFSNISSLRMQGAVRALTPITAPAAAKPAFTILFSTTNPNPSDIEINFTNVESLNDNAYSEVFNDGEVFLMPFEGLSASPPLTISAVPEPSTCVLASLGMAGFLLTRRRKNRVRKKFVCDRHS